MGLFGRKKKQEDSDRYEEVMRHMYAPKIPGEPDPWFSQNSVIFPVKSLFNERFTFLPNAWFNVEVAAMQISTTIPISCEECSKSDEVARDCSQCGKNHSNFTKVMTANSDGDYLGWEIFTDEVLKSQGISEGFFVSFDRASKIDFDGTRLSFESQKLAPVLINKLQVNPYTQNIGMLFFADAFAVLDGNDFISGIKVPSGEYDVVAWLGYTMNGVVAPLAVTVLSQNLVNQLGFKIETKENVPTEIAKCLSDSLDGNVLARFSPNMEALAQENGAFYVDSSGSDAFIANSWVIQHAFKENPDFFSEIVEDAFQSIEGAVILIECLRLRGQQKIAMEMVRRAQEKFGRNNETEEGLLLETLIKHFNLVPPGSHVVTVISNLAGGEMGEAEELNNQGFVAYSQGRKQEGMDFFREAAFMGQPNALANYTWYSLKDGDFQKGIELFDSTIDLVSESPDSAMIKNCWGNYALLLMAIGKIERAIDVSNESLDTQNYETHFFLSMMYLESGNEELARRVFGTIPKSSYSSLKKTLSEEFSEGTGWFSEWCGKGIGIFSQLARS